jgi:hypothetical protein
MGLSGTVLFNGIFPRSGFGDFRNPKRFVIPIFPVARDLGVTRFSVSGSFL